MTTASRLASVSEQLAKRPFDDSRGRNSRAFKALYAPFTAIGDGAEFDWCAAFVYHACTRAGIALPARPDGPLRGSLAGVFGWMDWAKLPENRCYYAARNQTFRPRRGDLVVFENLLGEGPCDHIGVVLSVRLNELRTAEGNVEGQSGVFRRKRNSKIRGYIRVIDGCRGG